MVSLSNGVLSDGDLSKLPLENGHHSSSSSVVPPKYKPRMVSAIRDFPPGCGRNALPLNSRPPETPVALVSEETADGFETNFFVSSEVMVESQCLDAVKSPVHEKINVLLDDLVEKAVTTTGIINGVKDEIFNPDPRPLENVSPKGLENNEMELDGREDQSFMEEETKALVKIVSVEEKNTVLEIGTVGDAVTPVGSAKSLSPPQWPISDRKVGEGTARSPKNKFRRRRVSAIRDFPPFCGRSAPPLTEEERFRITFENKSSGVGEKVGVGSEALGETLKAGAESGALGDTLRTGVDAVELGHTKGVSAEAATVRYIVRAGIVEAKGSVLDGNYEKNELKGIVPESRKKSHTVVKRENEDVEKVGKEIVPYSKDKSFKRRPSGAAVSLGREVDRVVVQGLMAAPNCPWRQGKGILTISDGGMSGSKVKKRDFTCQQKFKLNSTQNNVAGNPSVRKSAKEKSVYTAKVGSGSTGAMISRDKDDSAVHNEEQHEDIPAGRIPLDFNVSLPPFGPNKSNHGDARNRVRETLRLFQAICRKLLQGEEAKFKQGEEGKLRQQGKRKRIDLEAAEIIKKKGKEVNAGSQIVGAVPGVEVGDEFQYRVELAIVGAHRLYQAGIDYIKHGKEIIATSIVASGVYADDLDNADVLTYSGQGGNVIGKNKQPEDQKLERGNLALKNSISAENPVRVIRGYKDTKASDSLDGRPKMVTTYFYDGLYKVDKCRRETGPHGKLVFMFELKRIPGQPELALKEVKNSKKCKIREGLCIDDISGGKELFPIGAVNTINNEKPPSFTYITKMIYPALYHPIPPEGCDCTGRCSDSRKCSCAVKNGGEIPYNHNGAIVEAKTLVYECGPSCKCPPSCYNRVTQHGIKIHLEIFKTESRGWGVRSLSSIPSGSFLCEYAGELLEDKEAEQRIGNDEYLFDIGQNYNNCSLKPDTKSISIELLEDGGYTIDAAQYGNVGRFINHSCSPNLYAQNVLYDHEDKRMPHIMLFAAENIPPLQELTYHYNYSVDEIRDSSGNIKMKRCYCGSTECTGRMY